MNRELNSQIDIRSQDSHFSESDGAFTTSMLLWGVAYCVKKYIRDAYDSLCTHVLAAAAECGTTAPDCTSKTKSSTTQLVQIKKICNLA